MMQLPIMHEKEQMGIAAGVKTAATMPMQELLGIEWEKDFVGLGLDEEVPKFLRTNAKIKNRHMSKVFDFFETQRPHADISCSPSPHHLLLV